MNFPGGYPMKRFVIYTLLTLGLVASFAAAQCGTVSCGTAYGVNRVTYNTLPTYHAPAVTHQKVEYAANLLVLPLYVPAYQGIANPNHGVLPYQPNPPSGNQQAQQSDTDKILNAIGGVKTDINEVRSDVNGLRKRIEEVERKVNGSTVPVPTPSPNPPFKTPDPLGPTKGQSNAADDLRSKAVAIYKASCIQCHDASKAADEGGDFILMVNGAKASLSDKERAKMVSKVQKRGTGQMPPATNKYHLEALTAEQIEIVKQDNQ